MPGTQGCAKEKGRPEPLPQRAGWARVPRHKDVPPGTPSRDEVPCRVAQRTAVPCGGGAARSATMSRKHVPQHCPVCRAGNRFVTVVKPVKTRWLRRHPAVTVQGETHATVQDRDDLHPCKKCPAVSRASAPLWLPQCPGRGDGAAVSPAANRQYRRRSCHATCRIRVDVTPDSSCC